MLNQIGDVVPRFQVYERLFGHHTLVVKALSDAYVDIIAFCADAKSVFRKGKQQIWNNLKLFGKLTWKPFEEQFGARKAAFRNHVKNVEKSAGLSHMIEASSDREANRDHQQQVQKRLDEDRRNDMIASLSAVNEDGKRQRLNKARWPGTNDWILEAPEYVAWKAAMSSAILSIEGIPGSGKSVLVARILEELLASPTALAKVTLYHCFDFSDLPSLQFDQFLGTLTKQLCLHGAFTAEMEAITAKYTHNGMRIPAPDQLLDLLQKAFERLKEVQIIIDGLDDCDREVQRCMIDIIDQWTNNTNSCVSILITCRNETRTFSKMQNYANIVISTRSHGRDIEGYIQARLSCLNVISTGLRDRIVQAMVQRSHGLFLWVHFHLLEILEMRSESEFEEILKRLPKDLEEMYQRISDRVCRSSANRQMAAKIFRWIHHVKRPLSLSEMREAVAFDLRDKSWDASKLPFEDTIVRACFGLVTCDSHDSLIRFAHPTTASFLKEHKYLIAPAESAGTDDDIFIGEYCVNYLYFSDFETSLTKPEPRMKLQQTGILGPGGLSSIPTLLGLGHPILSPTERLFKRPARPVGLDIDYAKYLTVKPRRKAESTFAGYALLEYVINYWAEHTKYLADDSALYSKVVNLATRKQLPFEFRPWGVNRHFGPYGCQSCPDNARSDQYELASMFHWAAQEDHVALLQEALVYNKFYHHGHLHHERETLQTLKIACGRGKTKAFRLLLERGEPRLNQRLVDTLTDMICASNQVDCLETLLEYCWKRNSAHLLTASLDGGGPLYLAASFGRQATILSLLTLGANVCTSQKRYLELPIHAAIRNGHLSVVKILLTVHREYQVTYVTGREHCNALHIAAEYGRHEEMIQLLKPTEASEPLSAPSLTPATKVAMDRVDDRSMTPLMLAAANGQRQVVRSLLRSGANADKRTDHVWLPQRSGRKALLGDTALRLAVKGGHLNVVYELWDATDVDDPLEDCILYLAAAYGHQAIVTRLVVLRDWRCLESHVETAFKESHSTALRCLLEALDLSKRRRLLRKLDGDLQYSLLFECVKNGQPEVLQVLIDMGETFYTTRDAMLFSHADMLKDELGRRSLRVLMDSLEVPSKFIVDFWSDILRLKESSKDSGQSTDVEDYEKILQLLDDKIKIVQPPSRS